MTIQTAPFTLPADFIFPAVPAVPADLRALTDVELEALRVALRAAQNDTAHALGAVLYPAWPEGQSWEEQEKLRAPYWAAYEAHVAPIGELSSRVNKEDRRRSSNRTRAANAERNANRAAAVAAGGFQVGQAVQVHAFGHWYSGEVVKVGKATVSVRYTTGTGTTRTKQARGDLVRHFGG
jgi:hypothetical protein